jgi:hypothetical protein
MASIERRLDKLEIEQQAIEAARIDAQVQAFAEWLIANGTPIEFEAWRRFLMNNTYDEVKQYAPDLTLEQHAAILAGVGPFTDEDAAIVDLMWQRVPDEFKQLA